jgi:hypothetical protein
MQIYIPSINRVHEQPTLLQIPPKVPVTLVVPERQVKEYREKWTWAGNVTVLGHPTHFDNIGKVRHYILEVAYPNDVLMLDDDLIFFHRRLDERDKFEEATEEQIHEMLDDCKVILESYGHMAIATREGGNRFTELYNHNTRGLRALGYKTSILRDEGINFGRLPVMEDFDVTLQLLRKGYANRILNWMVHNQAHGSGAAGGCSTYRDLKMQEEAAHALKKLHPEFVTVVEKTTKTAWGGNATRTDVRIQWKKAYESSRA